MELFKANDIEKVWANICKYEGEIFFTVSRKIPYTYAVKKGYILVNNDTRRRITKDSIERALDIQNPTPSKIQKENIWGPAYICGIITDRRIV